MDGEVWGHALPQISAVENRSRIQKGIIVRICGRWRSKTVQGSAGSTQRITVLTAKTALIKCIWTGLFRKHFHMDQRDKRSLFHVNYRILLLGHEIVCLIYPSMLILHTKYKNLLMSVIVLKMFGVKGY